MGLLSVQQIPVYLELFIHPSRRPLQLYLKNDLFSSALQNFYDTFVAKKRIYSAIALACKKCLSGVTQSVTENVTVPRPPLFCRSIA